jgi:hypothetical protein
MYTLYRSLTVRSLLLQQLPALLLSLVIAEVFYKFHSFTLETAAFLVTWFVVDATFSRLIRVGQRRPAP